jgi:signal transduction histidine kinase
VHTHYIGVVVDSMGEQRSDSMHSPAPVGWPLVERRQRSTDPPDGVERRRRDETGPLSRDTPTIHATTLWPFRLAAYIAAVARAASENSLDSWKVWVCTAIIGAYTGAVCLRPIPYRNDGGVRVRIGIELVIVTAVVLVTAAWDSPFTLCLIPSGMLAAFAAGSTFSFQICGAAVTVISVQHIERAQVVGGIRDSLLWAGLLGLVGFTSGLTHRAAVDSARQQQLTLDRVNRLAEANSLLFSLTRVAQTLPATLDLDDVLDTTVGRVRSLVDHDSSCVYLYNAVDDEFEAIRSHGSGTFPPFPQTSLPVGLATARHAPKAIRLDRLASGGGVTESGQSGIYAALRARGELIGMLAIESDRPDAFGAQQAEIVHGLAEPLGIAIDNARMFRQIRTLAADEERSRIARDLHDRVGSSLALIGFEVDRASTVAAQGEAVEPVLGELRDHVRSVVVEVRDALSDLRAEVTDERDLVAVAEDFIRRFRDRTGVDVHLDAEITGRLPLPHERELWHILRESMVNVERHSQASAARVVVRENDEAALLIVDDNGIGYDGSMVRADSYGIVGMRERASHIGAAFSVLGKPEGGTEVRVSVALEEVDG